VPVGTTRAFWRAVPPPAEPARARRAYGLTHDLYRQTVERALCRLAHVRSLERLGRRGPLDASAPGSSAFACLFGRDSLRMALDLLDDFPEVARQTIRRLTALQGMRDHPRAEEEPGRILHEQRCSTDPHAPDLLACWDLPYYGSVDATPLYVCLIGAYCARYGPAILDEQVCGRAATRVSIRTGLERALGWIDRRLADHGYVCVQRAQAAGLQHQVWEDSWDSHFFEDGRLFDPDVPYAPVAVQGLVYDALLAAADLIADVGTAERWRAEATLLRRKVLREFWMPDLGTFAPALVLSSPDPMPARVVASSPGHLLATALLDGEDAAPYRERLVRRLLAPDLLAAAGIRTKSTTAFRFAPGAYHNGSVWPMDTGVIADGLRRHGYSQEADDLEDRILRACAAFGPVEFFRGDPGPEVHINTSIHDVVVDGRQRRQQQPPQPIQGWTATRLWRLLRRRDASVQATAPAGLERAA
jgi:glycogen debranching enzyme